MFSFDREIPACPLLLACCGLLLQGRDFMLGLSSPIKVVSHVRNRRDVPPDLILGEYAAA